MFAIRDEGGHLVGFGKMLRNRTDIRQRLEELHHRVDELTRENQRKDVFLGTLAHELRSPLAPLVNAVELIRLTEPKPPTLEYPVRLIERQVAALRRLVDDLLDLTRVGAGKIELRLEPIDLSVVISHAVDTVRPCFEQREHHLEVLQPGAPLTVRVDPVRLQQVFVNLLENACKYTNPGGRIWVESTVEGDEAVVNVIDTGIGIPPEMQDRIFDLFTQVETTPYGSRGGLGIGLALVRDLVALHGGSVQAMSHGADKGSRFSVRLPLAARDTAETSLRRA
jgi:signal transduction histidine kinase